MAEPLHPLTIRPWHTGDEIELTRLFQRAFGRTISVDHWRWKLRSEPHSFDNVWLAMNGDQPVFQYAGIPLRFKLADRPVQAVVSVDTMTAPEFRRRGLLTRVAGEAYSSWREAGAAFVIGLPNENWGSRASALGWQPLFPLQWLVCPLRPEVILANRTGWSALRHLTPLGAAWQAVVKSRIRPDMNIRIERVSRADSAFDTLWERCNGDWTYSTIRDRHWVQWRFLSAPSQRYEILLARRNGAAVGYLAHSVIESAERVTALIAELYAARTDLATRDSLLAALMERLRDTSAASIYALGIPGTDEATWLRRAGFFPSHAFPVQLVPLISDLPLERMSDARQWNLSGADFDIV
jgi:Acetyltransferase (GNAT) domain